MIYVEWIEPYIDSEPVICRVTKETAIRKMRVLHDYLTDESALEDFITVHWARIVDYPSVFE